MCIHISAQMGTFAETAKVYNRLSFADQGKLTSVFRIYIQKRQHIRI
jgi:hypothetical protein